MLFSSSQRRSLLAMASAALICSTAWAALTITPIIVTDMPAGTYSFPIAPVLNAGHTRNDCCYYHSEHTANTTGDSNIALCSSTYRWTLSPTGSTQHASIQVYYLELAAGGDPSIATPTGVAVDGIPWYSMTCGAQDPGSYCYGNVDTLGFNTIYIAMLNTAIPDPDDASYPDDTITAVYGQGARTKKYCSTGNYDKDTGALECTDNFLWYGYTSGDRILIQHANINSGTPTWTTVSSKTSKDAVVVATALSAGDITDNTVKIYTHVDPYLENRPAWSFPDMIYSYQNTDDRTNAASTTITTLTWDEWVAAPLFQSNGFGTREEDYSLTVYDDVNGLTSSALTGTYTDDFWSGARQIFISTSLGTDCGSCTTAVCGSGCTEISPCQTWACGLSQLVRTSGSAVLNVRQGETYNITADANLIGGDTDHKWICGTSYGSGADPIVETSPSGTDYLGLGGTTTNVRMNNIRFNRTGACSGGCSDLVAFTANNAAIFRCYFEASGGQSTVDVDGTGLAFLDNISFVEGTGQQYALFSMGGDAITAYSIRNRAFIGNQNWATNSSDAVQRMRGHGTVVANNHNEILSDATNQVSPVLRFALDNHPHYQVQTARNFLKRISGSTAPVMTSLPQSGGRFDWFRNDDNEYIGDGLNSEGYDSSGSGVGHIAFYNNVFNDTRRAIDVFNGTDLHAIGNTMYTDGTGAIQFVDSSGSTGYVNVWSLNNVASAPACNSSSRGFLNDGANAAKARSHVDKNLYNYASSVSGGFIRVASDNDTVADYETARPGLDIIGGSGGSAVDPKFAAPTTFDLRLCTGTNLPVTGCATSPAVDAGATVLELHGSYDGTVRPVNSVYDIGAFEMDTVTGKCCECDGTCTDTITEAACNALSGTFTAAGTCSGACATGACCTASEGACTVITDACCAESQWLTGDVCADCEWKCCARDGTCTEETEAVCDALTNATFTWGATCGTCAVDACCTDSSTCEVLTAEACAAEGKTNVGGSSCAGSPCAALATGSCCTIAGTCSVTNDASCSSPSIWTNGADCTPNDCAPAWPCCLDDETCEVETSVACAAETGTGLWIQSGTCSTGRCNIGACCNGASCSDTIAENCAFTWYADLLCADDPCSLGACCFTGASCMDGLSEVVCEGTYGGTYSGDDTTCDADCIGACWSNTCAECNVVIYDDCARGWRGPGTTCGGTTCVVGACYRGTRCDRMNEDACVDLTGTYSGDGTRCPTGGRGPLDKIFRRGPFGLGYGYDDTGYPWDK